MSQGEFYHPKEVAWVDNLISVQQYGFTINLSNHISEKEYASMTPQERQKFLTELALTESQKTHPCDVRLIRANPPTYVVGNSDNG